jgi:hypothetical protein
VLTFSGCGTKQSEAIPTSNIETNIERVANQIDAGYLVECYWDDALFLVKEDKPQFYLAALQEIKIAYTDCFMRHNGLVRALK